MADEPDSIVLQYLRRFDAKLDRVVDEMLDVKVRLTAVEEGLAQAKRGEFASDEQVAAMWKRWGL